jgi:ferredoxin-NADP reductase
MPSNGASIFVLSLLALNLLYLLLHSTSNIGVFADRTGLLFAANLPWLYLLGAKNQPIKLLTGHSYENLNILHRRLGEWMCFLALLHAVGFLIAWYEVLRPLGLTFLYFITVPKILFGLGAWTAYESLYVTSLASFRTWWYEVFLGTHIFLQIAALVCLFLHFHFARPYIGVALGIFLVDRVVYRLLFKTRSFEADLTVLPDGETTLVSANWSIPPPSTTVQRWTSKWLGNMKHGWHPSSHVFITIPSLSRAYRFQAHPMTIASAAPSSSPNPASSTAVPGEYHAWFNLIIRAQSGFSRALLHHVHENPRAKFLLDGPYGSLHALEMLQSSDNAILIAGGSGIAVVYPMIWAMLERENSSSDSTRSADDANADAERQEVERNSPATITLIWIVQDASHLSWLDSSRLEELSSRGVNVITPPPTRKSGRPDVGKLLREATAVHDDEDDRSALTGVVVSGPDGLNRSVRNLCAEMVKEGRDICVEVEKFGW